MPVEKALTLACEAIDVGCFDFRSTVATGIAPTHIIGEDDDDVGCLMRSLGRVTEACRNGNATERAKKT